MKNLIWMPIFGAFLYLVGICIGTLRTNTVYKEYCSKSVVGLIPHSLRHTCLRPAHRHPAPPTLGMPHTINAPQSLDLLPPASSKCFKKLWEYLSAARYLVLVPKRTLQSPDEQLIHTNLGT